MTIFYCNTYCQLIAAIQLSLTEFKGIETCFLIDSKMKLADQIVNKMIENKYADYVFKVEDKYEKWRIWMFSTPIHKKFDQQIIDLFGDDKAIECIKKCDTYFYANIGGPSLCLAVYLHRYNKELKVNMFEDGVSSYSRIFGNMIASSLKNENLIKRIVNGIFKTPYHYVSKYYVFLPELIVWDCPYNVTCIPSISQTHDEIKEMLNEIFCYSSIEDNYEEKVVFFEESYAADGVAVDDISVVKKLEECYGKNQIIIKLHPRDKQNRFKKLGYHTNINSSIPWEVIAMNLNLDSKILATISSTSLLNSFLLSEGKTNLFFCYQMIDYNKNDRLKFTVEVIKKLEQMYPNKFISMS